MVDFFFFFPGFLNPSASPRPCEEGGWESFGLDNAGTPQALVVKAGPDLPAPTEGPMLPCHLSPGSSRRGDWVLREVPGPTRPPRGTQQHTEGWPRLGEGRE